ncbi:carbohydrate-binding protein [Marinoscillum sp.]|uniref:carbohydrate-binding protein n=1 Tax=Marinoscillum sp. TaxID=2024838 RepID=UPI003BA8B415
MMKINNWIFRTPLVFLKQHLRNLLSALIILFLFNQTDAQSCWLEASGTQIVNASTGQPVILRAVGLGNWALQEGYMLNPQGCTGCPGTQWQMKLQYLNEGQSMAQVEAFYQQWRDNFITKADIDYIASLGFNSVRLPMHYELFLTDAQRAVRNSVITDINYAHDTYKNSLQTWYNNDQLFNDPNLEGFQIIDKLLDWCEANDMYVMLDLHAAPGGQGSDKNIADIFHENNLWQFPVFQDVTDRLWDRISERYLNEPRIAFYELINEPNNVPGGGQAIHALSQRLITTIRNNGDNHMIMVHGNGWGNNYDYMEPWTFSPNWGLVYSAHRYWIDPADDWVADPNPNQINKMANLIAFRDNNNVPVWVGETGENNNSWLRQNIEKLDNAGIGWCHWTYKRHDVGQNAALMRIGGNYPTDGASAMSTVLEMIKFENCIPNTNTIATVTQDLPAPWTSGCSGSSSAGCTGSFQSTSGNIEAESFCEMLGVQTESTTDVGGGQNVGYLDAGDWMAYRVNIPTSGLYNVTYRVASLNGGGSLQIESLGGGSVYGSVDVQATGGWQSWTTVSHTVSLNAGDQDIALSILSGGFNLNWLNITPVSGGAPIGQTIWLQGNNGLYVSSENGQSPMNCNRQSVGGWEQFTVVAVGSGQIALQGSNGQYVNSQNGQSGMTCTSPAVSGWEAFYWEDLGNNTVALRGFGDQYVSSENGQSAMICDRPSIGGWEVFTWGNASGSRLVDNVQAVEEAGALVYPNPISQSFVVDLTSLGLEKARLVVSDLSGRQLLSKEIGQRAEILRPVRAEEGIYLIRIAGEDTNLIRKVIFK